MKRIARQLLTVAMFLSVVGVGAMAQTIEQQLLVVRNDKTVGGVFQLAVQVKGTSLPAANTLGSATIDVQFDNTILTYVSPATLWAFGPGDGYTRSATNNTTFIRVGVTGGGVGPSFSTVGFDIGSTYVTWVQLNFTIANASSTTNLTIASGTNAIGLFENHQNDPETGVINNQTLSPPVNVVDQPLPIQLASFSASAGNGTHVTLNWTTVSEKNNYGFEIQRSLDPKNEFQTIPGSFVKGNGTTVQQHSYSYTIVNNDRKLWYYRLKQTDLGGSITYSEAIQAGSAGKPIPKEFALDQNYPNPFNPTTTISFAVPKDGDVTVEVFNVLGQRVVTLAGGFHEAGYYTVPFDARLFSSGVYFYRMTTKEATFLKKMIVVK